MARLSSIADRESQRVCEKTRRRQSRRSKEEIEVLEFQRDCLWMARRYRRFRAPVLVLCHFARVQLRSEQTKRNQIVRAVKRWTMLSEQELMTDTRLDRISLRRALAIELGPNGRLEAKTREGDDIVTRGNGRPLSEPFFRLRLAASSEGQRAKAA